LETRNGQCSQNKTKINIEKLFFQFRQNVYFRNGGKVNKNNNRCLEHFFSHGNQKLFDGSEFYPPTTKKSKNLIVISLHETLLQKFAESLSRDLESENLL
jgi:hypothetical protein